MSRVAISASATGTGTVTLAAPVTNTDRTIVLPDSAGTILTTATPGVPIGGPAFSAYSTANQSITSSTSTKIVFQAEEFDTNNCFDTASSRFTPTVAGYYQVSGAVYPNSSTTFAMTVVARNGSNYKALQGTGANVGVALTCLVYMNGSTDFIELYGYLTGTSPTVYASPTYTFFQAALIRSAT